MNAFIAFNSQKNEDLKHVQQRFRLGDIVEANIINDSDEWIKCRLIRRNQNGTWDVQVYGLTGGKGIAFNVSKSNIRHPKRDHDTFAPNYVFYEQNQKRRRALEEASRSRQVPRKEARKPPVATPATPRTIFKRDPARRRFAKARVESQPGRSRLQTIKSTTFQPINKNSRIINSDDYLLIDLSTQESTNTTNETPQLEAGVTNAGELNDDKNTLERNYAKAFEPLDSPQEAQSAPLPSTSNANADSLLAPTRMQQLSSNLKPYETLNTFRRKVNNPDLSENLLKHEDIEFKSRTLPHRGDHFKTEDSGLNSFPSYESIGRKKEMSQPPLQLKEIPKSPPVTSPKPDIFPSQHPYAPALKSLHSQLIQIVNNPPTYGLKKVDTNKGVELWKKDGKPATIYLAMTVFPRNASSVWAKLRDIKQRAGLYNQLKEFRVLRPGDVNLCYESHKCPWPVTDRDFEYVTQEFVQPKTYAIVSTSTREKTHSAQKKHIRGHIYFGAWILREIHDQQTVVYHLSQTDPAGKIPKFALQFSTDVMCQAVRNLRALV